MLIPFRLNFYYPREPLGNYGLIFLLLLLHTFSWIIPIQSIFELNPRNLWSFLTHFFIHSNFFTLVNNCLFLWVFGNALCAICGNFRYIAIFIVSGLVSGILHLFNSNHAAIGTGGALNGVAGIFLVFFYGHKVSCVLISWKLTTIDIQAFWVVGFWILSNLFDSFFGKDSLAYSAGIFLFIFGIAVGFVLKKTGLVKTTG